MAQKASTGIPISRKTKLRLEKMKKSIARRIGRAVSYDEAIRTLLGRPTTRSAGYMRSVYASR